jgi:hypothetical protein
LPLVRIGLLLDGFEGKNLGFPQTIGSTDYNLRVCASALLIFPGSGVDRSSGREKQRKVVINTFHAAWVGGTGSDFPHQSRQFRILHVIAEPLGGRDGILAGEKVYLRSRYFLPLIDGEVKDSTVFGSGFQ